MKQKVKYKGILFIVLSALCFAFMNMFVRMAGDLPAVQKSFFRNLVAFIIALATMVRHKEVFQVEKAVIVTQRYHLYRALYSAGRLGLEAVGCPADLRKYSGQSGREIREILARDKEFFKLLVKPQPQYLGEAIPVSGDGNVTLG